MSQFMGPNPLGEQPSTPAGLTELIALYSTDVADGVFGGGGY